MYNKVSNYVSSISNSNNRRTSHRRAGSMGNPADSNGCSHRENDSRNSYSCSLSLVTICLGSTSN